MIVTEDNMSVAVEFLADDARAARVKYDATKAATAAKTAYYRAFLSINEKLTVSEKEARAWLDPGHLEAMEQEAIALGELDAHKQRKDWAETMRELFRTERADIRAAERIR